MKHLSLFLTVFVSVHFSFAQSLPQLCGTDEMSYKLYHDYPLLRAQMDSNRAYLKQFTQQYIEQQQARGQADSVYTIPVVFHIIHTYGLENVSDEQVMSGLEVLNRNFGNHHPDSANIVAAFQSIAADCQIEFKLAHLDPNGNCTSGINRIASTFTKIGDHSVKDLIHWDPSKYLNVYVVKTIANLAGHCLMPDQAAAKPEWDGIVIDDSYLGNTGTSSEFTSVVMAHEAGHYLNLFHIWGGNNVPGYFYQPVGQAGNCAIGDDVADTPPTIGWSSCNLNASSCSNTVDNVQNAMDYSYCNFMFTQGQRQRMRAALNAPVANRNNLITLTNLQAAGVNLNTVCRAAFTADRNIACAFDTIFFTDKSITAPDSWLWNFGDNTTDTAQNPAHIFYVPGDYYVTLTAGKNGSTVISDSFLIHINPSNPLPYFVEGFESVNNIPSTGLVAETDNPSLSYQIEHTGQGYNSASAAVIRMADTSIAYSGHTVLTSRAIDLSASGLPTFSFKFACSQKKLNSDDVLEVLISTDCGKTWLTKGKRLGANLRTTLTAQTDTAWYPTDSTDWKTYSFQLTAQQAVSSFMFRIVYNSYYTNTFHIDNINLNATAFNGLEKTETPSLGISPNPTTGLCTIAGFLGKEQSYKVQVLNTEGKSILETNNQTTTGYINQQLALSHLPKGVYLVRIQTAGETVTRSVVLH